MGRIVTVVATLALQIVFTNFVLSVTITFKFRQNKTCANFVRRNGIRLDEMGINIYIMKTGILPKCF